MYCPLCGAEYRPGFTVCSDCQVALVPDPPRGASANPSSDDAPEDTSFALLWSGSDGRSHAEICEALERQGIPLRSLDTDDYLFNLTMQPAHQVYVPVDLVKSAQEAIQQIIGREDSEEPPDSDIVEIPAEDDLTDYSGYDDGRSENLSPSGQHNLSPRGQRLDPEDATVEIWSGQDADLAAMITASLRENEIVFRSDSDVGKPESVSHEEDSTRVFVFPEDEKRAKAIVHEIIDAVPPE